MLSRAAATSGAMESRWTEAASARMSRTVGIGSTIRLTRREVTELSREFLQTGRIFRYMSGRADIHFHLLPGVDDGPATLEGSVALARVAVGDGTASVVATPHVRPDHV